MDDLTSVVLKQMKRVFNRVRPFFVRDRRAFGTIIDAHSISDVKAFVRSQERGDGCGALVNRIDRIFRTFVPEETTMRRLSILQQMYSGNGNDDEFCVLTVYVIASDAVLHSVPRKKKCRVKSEPSCTFRIAANPPPRRHRSFSA